jgi:deaminated glutathione amidase
MHHCTWIMETPMGRLAIAALQLALKNEDNLAQIEREIVRTCKRFPWVQMVVLPELCTFGPNPKLAVQLPGEVENSYRELARQNNIWLIPGSIFERDGAHIYNTSPVINPAGEVVARHRKLFPFMPYESGVSSGDRFVVFDVPGAGRVGLLICYDMWFPEVARTLAWMGAEAIICPTMTTTIDRDVELAISRSTAAINQAWFINVNTAGDLGLGRSIVVAPDGTVVYTAGSMREIITVELDFAQVQQVRERGLFGQCQTLKSFRDRVVEFPQYQKSAGGGAFDALGKLQLPEKSSE